jgi:hypothetical protein
MVGRVFFYCYGKSRLCCPYGTKLYIDVFVGSGQDNIWRFNRFYGQSKWSDKCKSWEPIRELKEVCDMPWLIMEGLNEILYPFEKEGSNSHPLHFMHAFTDAGYIGDKFTWHA